MVELGHEAQGNARGTKRQYRDHWSPGQFGKLQKFAPERVCHIDMTAHCDQMSIMLKDELYKSIGQRIASAREGKMTQLELARRIGMSRPAVANIERGEQQIYAHQLIAIAEKLSVDLGDLIPSDPYIPISKANVSVSGDKLNRSQERAVKELVSSITTSARK